MNEYPNNNHSSSSWLKKFSFILLFLCIFGLGIFVGLYYSAREYVLGESGQIKIEKVLDLYGKSRSPDVSFDQFWNVWDIIKSKYVEQPVDESNLFYGAIKGLVAGLGDPYSAYFPPVEAKEFAKHLAGEFEGIGAEVGVREGQLIIVAPLPGSPAETAGLRAGDKVFAINEKETFGMTLEEAVMNIRGKKGTIVVLTITHNGFDTIEDVSVVRNTITVPTVIWEIKEDDIAYMRLSYFNENTWLDFDKAVQDILLANIKGIVLDMRMNPGGFLQTSVDVASEWIKEGKIVTERFADGKENVHRTRGKHRFVGVPTVVLVDQGTASGSEIVAGAIQDHKVGTIVGLKTFGKGSVQDFQILSDGSALKLTIARWFTPNDLVIEGKGIIPDIVLDKMFYVPEEGDEKTQVRDLGVEKAIELLKK